MPTQRDVATINVVFSFHSQEFIIFIPLTIIAPNIITVQPPSTHDGSVEKNAPTGGNKPAIISVKAPNIIVHLLTTLVIATSPTFWLKEVIGEHPNTPAEIADIKPSQQREPDTSFSMISLFKPPVQIAVVSPIVSAAKY